MKRLMGNNIAIAAATGKEEEDNNRFSIGLRAPLPAGARRRRRWLILWTSVAVRRGGKRKSKGGDIGAIRHTARAHDIQRCNGP